VLWNCRGRRAERVNACFVRCPRKAPCRTVLPLAVVVSSLPRSAVSPYASRFVTAWPVNAEPAASSGNRPGFVAKMSRSPAFHLSTSVLATKALTSGSTFARPADQLSTISWRLWRSTLQSPLAHLPIQVSRRRSSPSTRLECTAGSFLRQTPSTSHERTLGQHCLVSGERRTPVPRGSILGQLWR